MRLILSELVDFCWKFKFFCYYNLDLITCHTYFPRIEKNFITTHSEPNEIQFQISILRSWTKVANIFFSKIVLFNRNMKIRRCFEYFRVYSVCFFRCMPSFNSTPFATRFSISKFERGREELMYARKHSKRV